MTIQERTCYRVAPRPVTLDAMTLTLPLETPASPRMLQVLANVAPNWFASVMGTGIVATASASLPAQFSGLRTFATAVWLLAATMLVSLGVATVLQWTFRRDRALAHADHPVAVHFYGALPMAMLTVGAGTLALGSDVIGVDAALGIDWVLWLTGTALGLATTVWVPFRMITGPEHHRSVALPAWLMPVVPPMVSATTGALLLEHVPPGSARTSMLVTCYALFGIGLIVGTITWVIVYSRIVRSGVPELQSVPTVWIGLGLIGQSVTAANVLGATSGGGLHVFGIVFGVAVGGVGALVFAFAAVSTVRAARRGLRFTMAWWSFTFPIGTCVTGATALGSASGCVAVQALAVSLFVVLVTAWAVVASRTVASVSRWWVLGCR